MDPATQQALLKCCKQEFKTVNDLEAHISAEHFNCVPYECEQCPYAKFPTEYSVREHQKSLHDQQEFYYRCKITPEIDNKRKLVKQRLQELLMVPSAQNNLDRVLSTSTAISFGDGDDDTFNGHTINHVEPFVGLLDGTHQQQKQQNTEEGDDEEEEDDEGELFSEHDVVEAAETVDDTRAEKRSANKQEQASSSRPRRSSGQAASTPITRQYYTRTWGSVKSLSSLAASPLRRFTAFSPTGLPIKAEEESPQMTAATSNMPKRQRLSGDQPQQALHIPSMTVNIRENAIKRISNGALDMISMKVKPRGRPPKNGVHGSLSSGSNVENNSGEASSSSSSAKLSSKLLKQTLSVQKGGKKKRTKQGKKPAKKSSSKTSQKKSKAKGGPMKGFKYETVHCVCGEEVKDLLKSKFNHINVKHMHMIVRECLLCPRKFEEISVVPVYFHLQAQHKVEVDMNNYKDSFVDNSVATQKVLEKQMDSFFKPPAAQGGGEGEGVKEE